MLSLLRIRDLALIESAEVEFGDGLNVITGETGAGKSMLVDALQLIAGARATADKVREGCQRAEVEAVFELDDDKPAPLSDGAEALLASETSSEVILRRVLTAQGRSRAYVNGRLATLGQMQELGRHLLDICSQHEHHSLTEPKSHLQLLDTYGALQEKGRACAEAVDAALAAQKALAQHRQGLAQLAQQQDFLRYQVDEIDAVAPQVGEDESLAHDRQRLRHGARLVQGVTEAEGALYSGEHAVVPSLQSVAAALAPLAALDTTLEPLREQILQAAIQLEDAAQELGSYAREAQFDDAELVRLEDRLAALEGLKRKHGGSLAGVLAFRQRADADLRQLDDADARDSSLEQAFTSACKAAARCALTLRSKRLRLAQKLASDITKQLGALGMGDARITVAVEALEGRAGELAAEGARLTRRGIDRVELRIAPNRGEAVRPLHRIASGGELSRTLLAVKRVMADRASRGVYVFDEVDAGVGGAVAESIGHSLVEVADRHQVLCITHLPQIAAQGCHHFHVRKTARGGRTRSSIETLSPEARREEIARMLGGKVLTDKARAAAEELLGRGQAAPRLAS